ncbi:hypothetical protein P9A14_02520 [Gordonia hongkongensis]|uniref:Uncharacterized protein n=1 Tax=Gordonia hongkongensis TaxID=1701090 RepID=A0AAX3T958_9ACTN|nr:hypothetical protein [Gordonia hongkongensis]QIK49649.1 hypothetical protein G8C36_22220 [Gordonia terrae]WFP25418.1 hypothetical protein P9A14_02520 [Gordonia hongkongensis]
MPDPHGALRDALHKAFTAGEKKQRTTTPTATSIDDVVAQHYTPTTKEGSHDD